MRRIWSERLFFAAVGLLAAGLAGAEPVGEVHWVERPADAFDAAADRGDPVLVDYWAIWCEPCKLMDETTYRDPRVLSEMDRFVPLKINVDTNPMFADRYSVDAYPTLLFLDEHGDEIGRLAGMIEAPELLAAMRTIREGYAEYQRAVEARDDPRAAQAASGYLLAAGNGEGASRLLRDALKLAKKQDADAIDSIELDLARALLAEGRAGSAVKTLDRLSRSAATEDVRASALVELVRAERERGRDDRADDALDRLAREYPELAEMARRSP